MISESWTYHLGNDQGLVQYEMVMEIMGVICEMVMQLWAGQLWNGHGIVDWSVVECSWNCGLLSCGQVSCEMGSCEMVIGLWTGQL